MNYNNLQDLCLRHFDKISRDDSIRRSEYLFGTQKKIEKKRGVMLGCIKMLEQANKCDIPEEIFLNLSFPHLMPYFETQCNWETCATAIIRAVNIFKNGIVYTEPQMWKMNGFRKLVHPTRDKLIDDGFGPAEITHLIKYMELEFFGREVKTFMTNNGTIDQLKYHLSQEEYPIIVRPWGYAPWEIGPGRPGPHYGLVFGADDSRVYLFNPENEPIDSNLHSFKHKDFMRWWAYGYKGLAKKSDSKPAQRWYIVPVSKDITLSRKEFNGKYL